MQTEDRRSRLKERLRQSRAPMRGTELAQEFGVSRQIVVQDIAVLRAQGEPIVATPRGYLWDERGRPEERLVRAVLAVRHGPELTADELFGLVEAGVRVVDVVVEHPLYGELRGRLDLADAEDVQEWLRAREELGATLLSSLTGGVHLHTVEAEDVRAIRRAQEVVRRLGIALE